MLSRTLDKEKKIKQFNNNILFKMILAPLPKAYFLTAKLFRQLVIGQSPKVFTEEGFGIK